MTGARGARTNRELVAAHGYDSKCAMHALRLGLQGVNLLTVARVQVIVAGQVIERETAMTPAGERTLPLDAGTVRALRGHCAGSSTRNGLRPARHISLVPTAATWPPTRPAPATARSGYAVPSTAW